MHLCVKKVSNFAASTPMTTAIKFKQILNIYNYIHSIIHSFHIHRLLFLHDIYLGLTQDI